MATTTPLQSLPVPELTDDPDVVGDMTALAVAIEKRLMGVYASATDRNTKVSSPQNGQFAFLVDTGKMYVYRSSAWNEFPAPQVSITAGSSVPSNSVGNDGDVFFKV